MNTGQFVLLALVIIAISNVGFLFKRSDLPRRKILIHAVCLVYLVITNHDALANSITFIFYPDELSGWAFVNKGIFPKQVVFTYSMAHLLLGSFCACLIPFVSSGKDWARVRLLQIMPFLMLIGLLYFYGGITMTVPHASVSLLVLFFVLDWLMIVFPYYLIYKFYRSADTVQLLFKNK